MRHIVLFGFILSIALFAGCEEDEFDPTGERNVGVVPTITDINPAIYISGELEESFVQFTVNLDEDASYDEAYVVGSYNGVSQRSKLTDISSFPADITLSAADVASKLGMSVDDVESQDYFVFEVETVVDGVVTRSNAGLTVRVVCPFDPAMTNGGYTAVSDGWGVNGGVTIEADEDDPYTVYVSGLAALDGVTEDQGPLVMKIDPLSFAVTAERTVLASEAFGYTNFAYEGSGEFNSCTGTYDMQFTITVDQGSFGGYEFSLTRD